MYLIAALGNYGDKYANTRHNAGWLLLDEMLGGNADWAHSKYANAEYLHDTIGDKEVEYIKPRTMMNLSGQSVSYMVKKHEILPAQVIVIHDDLAIPMGELKISYNRGSGEHNGVESVTRALGTQEYIRIRVGIGGRGLIPLKSYVLMQFSDAELQQLRDLAPKLKKALKLVIEEGVEKAMNIINEKSEN